MEILLRAVAEQGVIAARGQIYMGAPIGVVEMQLEIAVTVKVLHRAPPPPSPPTPQLIKSPSEINAMKQRERDVAPW